VARGNSVAIQEHLFLEQSSRPNHNTVDPALVLSGPFSPDDETAYRRWRAWKLHNYPASSEALIVKIDDPRAITDTEMHDMLRVCAKTNMVIYASSVGGTVDKAIVRALGERFGLRRLDVNPLADDDGITSLRVVPGKSGRGYIPYSNHRLLWHTDGYYNPPQQSIRAFLMHCVCPAAEGGENSLLDHEIAYILMRDVAPDYIRALMAPDAMTIPANNEGGIEHRAPQNGPVFAVDPHDGSLLMRYTARTRSIVWKQDTTTLAAVEFLARLLEDGSPYVFRHRLAAGEGLLCSNVLHNRTGFTDHADHSKTRLLYRARFHDRIAGTDINTIFC